MTTRLLLTCGLLAASLAWSPAQTQCGPLPHLQWLYGGNSSDYVNAFLRTTDGGYFIAGPSTSPTGGTKTSPDYGSFDFWLLRLGFDGEISWQKSFGGSNYDWPMAAVQTSDGGFLVVGHSSSPISGTKTTTRFGTVGDQDYWLVRVEADGTQRWDRTFGGTGYDTAAAVLPLSDGGFIVGGTSDSNVSGNKTTARFGGGDYWVIRIDADGNKVWEKVFGGVGVETFTSMAFLTNGNILLGGNSSSDISGNKTSPINGGADVWVVEIDLQGNALWDRSIGGSGFDGATCLLSLPEGGVLVGAISSSTTDGLKTSIWYGGNDYWLLRLDETGAIQWQNSYGGSSDDILQSLTRVDAGFAMAGYSVSRNDGNKESLPFGGYDLWVVRMDETGNKLWDKSYGGNASEASVNGLVTTSSAGRLMLAANSDSAPSGNKTVGFAYNEDIWLLQLAPESDCDLDGVPNAMDLCVDTPLNSLVDTNGCSIEQYCPCQGPFAEHSDYVDCVERVTGDFVAAGRLSAPEALQIVNAAQSSTCPIDPSAVIFFGLTNGTLGGAGFVELDGSGYLALHIITPDFQGYDGVAVYLGEADSGVFIYPTAEIWGNYDEQWFMLGRAYGSLNGVRNALLGTVRGTKPYYERYPVEVDLSPLNPVSLTFQAYLNNELLAETTVEGATGSVTIQTSEYLAPRVNPIWRRADGSIGTAIELTSSPHIAPQTTIDGPFGRIEQANRIFIRANMPSNQVDYVSRVEVFGGGGFSRFTFTDERLGAFSHAHKALGLATLHAKPGELAIRYSREPEGELFGVLMDIAHQPGGHAMFQPIQLGSPSTFHVIGTGYFQESSATESFGFVRLLNHSGVLKLNANFHRLFTGPADFVAASQDNSYFIRVYRDGKLAGSLLATNADICTLTITNTNTVPTLIAAGTELNSESGIPHLALTFEQNTIVTGPDGSQAEGTHIRIVPIAPTSLLSTLDGISFGITDAAGFVIIGESARAIPPALSILRIGSNIALSWPVGNHPFVIESSTQPGYGYAPIEATIEIQQGRNVALLPIGSEASVFFRLGSAPE